MVYCIYFLPCDVYYLLVLAFNLAFFIATVWCCVTLVVGVVQSKRRTNQWIFRLVSFPFFYL